MHYSEKDLTDREYQMLQSELRNYDRSHGVAYLLWFFLGVIGIHKFYIGKTGMGFLYMGLWVMSIIGFVFTLNNPENVGWWIFPGGGLGLLLLYDLFSIPSQINSVKRSKKKEIVRRLAIENKTQSS